MPNRDICFTPATEQARMIRDREISAVELMQAHLDQIEEINPIVNGTLDDPSTAWKTTHGQWCIIGNAGAVGQKKKNVAPRNFVLTGPENGEGFIRLKTVWRAAGCCLWWWWCGMVVCA